MAVKRFKDPIYGYIEIEDEFLTKFIDTAEFQRLRSIRQTSYAPLYSAALHNRFIHSIGVFHLGNIAFDALQKSIESKYPDQKDVLDWESVKRIFLLACLLHDIGHSPFSHSGEIFYLDKSIDDTAEIYKELISSVDDETFTNDMNQYHVDDKQAAPHEIMSALVAINEFKSEFENVDNKVLFVRCITGYLFSNESNIKNCIFNIIISLLNSTIIDVDKLDYLIRDAYVTGYDTVTIDYIRLLQSITMIKAEGKYCIAYKKSALSVLEDVIYAHDSERKWIQNHPVVLYEHFLIQNIMKVVKKFVQGDSREYLFTRKALGQEGIVFNSENKVRLLSDDDILFYAKNRCKDAMIDEYFQRKERRHAIWKSEAEYKSLFVEEYGERPVDKLENLFLSFEKFLNDEQGSAVVNICAKQLVEKQLEMLEKSEIGKSDKDVQINRFNNYKQLLDVLEKFSYDSKLDFDYVIISAKQFKSGFQKKELENTFISFPNIAEDNFSRLGKVINLLTAKQQREKFFFLYYKRKENIKWSIPDLASRMYDLTKNIKN